MADEFGRATKRFITLEEAAEKVVIKLGKTTDETQIIINGEVASTAVKFTLDFDADSLVPTATITFYNPTIITKD